jgi:hypothetical protein
MHDYCNARLLQCTITAMHDHQVQVEGIVYLLLRIECDSDPARFWYIGWRINVFPQTPVPYSRRSTPMPKVRPTAFLFFPVVVVAAVTAAAEPNSFAPRLFAFQNGVDFGPLNEEAATLKALGYDGVGSVGLDRLDDRIAAYEAVGLKVFSINEQE